MAPSTSSIHCRMRAYGPADGDCPLVAVDLGFSSRSSSNGVVSPQHAKGRLCKFGEMIPVITEALRAILSDGRTPLLIIEAPLSKFFNEDCNPEIRFATEQGRGWWYGPGATVALGAIELIERLLADDRLNGKTVLLAEAFCSHKAEATGHLEDARLIYAEFPHTEPEDLKTGDLRPISPCIEGIPPVRVFKHPEHERDDA